MTSDANRARHKKFMALSEVGRLKGSAYSVRGVMLSIKSAARQVTYGGAAGTPSTSIAWATLMDIGLEPYEVPQLEPRNVSRRVFCHDRVFARLDDPDVIVVTRWSVGPHKDP